MTLTSYIWNKRPTPGGLIAAVFFGLFVTGVVLLVGWFILSTPQRVELHQIEGKTYVCRYYSNEIKCELWNDSHVGGGKINP